MIEVVFPVTQFKIEKREGTDFIFDTIRKQWIVLTDEEWVRQNFIRFLVQEMNYPETLIAVEKEIQLGDLKKRFDILVYNRDHKPWMLVECKGPGISPDEKVFQQVLRYHISVPCPFLIITNGQYTFGWEKKDVGLKKIEKLPLFI